MCVDTFTHILTLTYPLQKVKYWWTDSHYEVITPILIVHSSWLPVFRSPGNCVLFGTNPESTSAAPALERCPGWSQREKTSTGKKNPSTWVNKWQYCGIAVLTSDSARQQNKKQQKQTNKTKQKWCWPHFSGKVICGIECASLEGGVRVCRDGMLPSIHLCCLLCCECQTQRLWHPPPFQSSLFTPPTLPDPPVSGSSGIPD